jgi:hypothetical protein
MPLNLRAYQVHVFREICEPPDDILVQLPTGSGKTLLLSAAVASLLQKGAVSHAVIACPQLHIAEGFLGWATGAVSCGAETVLLGPGTIRPLEEGAKTAQIIDYLQSAARGYAIAVSHLSVSNIPGESLPQSLAGYLLVIDEAHHAALETRLGRFLATWRARGGRVVSATATDFRADGRSVRLDGMRLVRRSLAEHLRDRDPPGPYAPERVESEIVGIEMPGAVTAGEVEGKELPHEEQQRRMVARMVERWEELGRPKTMVKVPVLDGGSSSLVGLLVQGYQAAGARVYDAAGVGDERQGQFIRFLAEQRGLAEYADAHDVVVGVQRVIEGTDWPWCSDVFVVGIPRSLVQTIQLLGRATRHKHWASYDGRFRDRARITFFVPTREGAAMSGLDLGHSRKVLALLAFMADTETGLQWVLFDQIRAGLLQSLADRRRQTGAVDGTGESADAAAADDVINRLVEGIDPRYEGIARTVLAVIREEAGGRELSYGEALDRLRAHDLIRAIPEEERAELLPQLLVRAMEAADPTGRVRRRVRRAVADRVAAEGDALGREDLAAVWEEVVAEFREVTMPTPPDQARFDRFLHQLTGGTIAAFADRLAERYKSVIGAPIAIEELHEEIWEFYEREGRWPSCYSGEVERFGGTYQYLDNYLRQGWRGLPGNSSLYQECKKVAAARGVPIEDRSCDDTPITPEMVREAIRAFFRQHNRFPKRHDGECPLGPNWLTLNSYLLKGGYRSLPGGSSLAQEVAVVRRELGLEPPALTRDRIQEAIEEYRKTTSAYPTNKTKGPAPGLGLAWGSLDNWLKRGGLGDKTTLAELVREVRTRRGDLPPGHKTPLSLGEVHEAIREYARTYGARPTRTTGLPCGVGITWATLENALKKGMRGLPGGSSLAKECDLALPPVEGTIAPTPTAAG